MQHSVFTNECETLKRKYVQNGQKYFYLFGYGSLLWKVDFDYRRKIHGYVKNYQRSFWLLSDDHRGTPEKMGRVVTLVKTNESRVYGIAYEFDMDNFDTMIAYLNFREKCGYSLNEVEFCSIDESAVPSSIILNCICYFANESNPYYSAEQNLAHIADTIAHTWGPSGANKEYLYNLCQALREISLKYSARIKSEIENYDKHLFELEFLVKQLENK